MGVQSFFVMDENFLLNRPRALQLLRLMQEHNKSWALYVFSSINAIRKYSMEELVQLGVSWIWVGLESPQVELRQAERLRHACHRCGVAQPRNQAAGIDDRWARAPHAGKHPGRHRLCDIPRYGLPSVHAVHARTGNSALSPDESRRAYAGRR